MLAADDDDFTTLIATIMNPAEQRQRSTAVQTVERRVDDLETVVKALAGEMVKDREVFQAHLKTYGTHRADQCDQRKYLDSLDRELRWSVARLDVRTVLLCHSTLLTRLRWLLLGS